MFHKAFKFQNISSRQKRNTHCNDTNGQDLEKVYYKHIKQAQSSRVLKTAAEPRLLARHLTNLWNGIHITARMYNNKKELASLIKINLDLIA